MIQLIAAHPQLARVVVLVAFAALLFGALKLAARATSSGGRHRSKVRAARTAHTPAHAVRRPRHRAAQHGPATVLGRTPDGDLTLVHAEPAPVDPDRTVEVPALIGAAA